MADYTPREDCIFCKIIKNQAPADIMGETSKVIFFTPLQPYVPGHVLAVPKAHVEALHTSAFISAELMRAVSDFCYAEQTDYNVLTSAGAAATQTVMHLHVHIIPRNENDNLHSDWPWRRDLQRIDGHMPAAPQYPL